MPLTRVTVCRLATHDDGQECAVGGHSYAVVVTFSGTRPILDALFTLACVSAAASVWFTAQAFDQPWRVGVLVASLLAAIGAWVWRRRTADPRVAVLVFAVAVVVATALTDGPTLLPLVFVAFLIALVDVGVAAALTYATSLLCLLVAIMAVGYHQPWESVAAQTLGLILVFAFGLLYAALVRAAEQARREREAALTQRAAAITQLQAANAQLKQAARVEHDLVLAQERARSARELHDGLGHRLSVMTMSLDFADRMRERAPTRAWEEVRAARDVAGEAMREMRLWVRALHPPDVGDLTDVVAFDALAESFRGTGIDVRVEITGHQRPLPQEVSLLCHRSVQEGLTNVLKHAQATEVVVALEFRPDRLRLELRDNGVGVVDVVEGFGLRSLRERATDIGGTVHLASAGHGSQRWTTLSVDLPLPATSPGSADDHSGRGGTRSNTDGADAGASTDPPAADDVGTTQPSGVRRRRGRAARADRAGRVGRADQVRT